MARPKDPQREALVRQKIEKAFSSLLVQKNWEEISIKDICHTAKVSVGSFYYYYPSKDHLMFAKVDVMDHYFDTIVRDEVMTSGFSDAILIYVRAYVFWSKKKGAKYSSQVLKFHLNNEAEGLITSRGVYKCLHDIIVRAKKLGDISSSLDTGQMILELTGAIRGAIFEWCLSPEKFDLDVACEHVAKFYSSGWLSIL